MCKAHRHAVSSVYVNRFTLQEILYRDTKIMEKRGVIDKNITPPEDVSLKGFNEKLAKEDSNPGIRELEAHTTTRASEKLEAKLK